MMGYALLIAGALPAGLYVLAAALGAVIVAECAGDWIRATGAGEPMAYDEDNEEDE